MDKPDKTIANAIAASPAAPERDPSFVARVEHHTQRRRASAAIVRRVGTALLLVLSASLATLAFELVSETLATFGSSPLSTAVLMAIGAFTALLFREMTEFALDR